MKVHEVIISLASNENQEANMAKAREQLTQLMVEVPLQGYDHLW